MAELLTRCDHCQMAADDALLTCSLGFVTSLRERRIFDFDQTLVEPQSLVNILVATKR